MRSTPCEASLSETRTSWAIPRIFNPAVRSRAHSALGGVERIHLIRGLGYLEFADLMARAYLILTDSGGIQEGAPLTGEARPRPPKRDRAGGGRGVGRSCPGGHPRGFLAEALFRDPSLYRRMSTGANPFADGKASRRIADVLRSRFLNGPRLKGLEAGLQRSDQERPPCVGSSAS